MNAEPRKRGAVRLVAPLAAALAIVLLAALTISGHWPELRQVVPFAGQGLVGRAPSDIMQVEMRAGQESIALRRATGGWTIDGMTEPVPAKLASHIETGLRFLHVSEPAREIAPSDLTPASFAEFGLEPPASVVALGAANGPVATVNFGVLNPVGTSQYVRVGGSPTVYLMPRHVGSEWQVASDMARRLRAQAEPALAHRGQSLFLPVSMAQVWAVEIVAGGKLTASSAIARAIGSGIPASIRTRPTPMPTSPIRRRPALSRPRLNCSMQPRSRRASAAPPMPRRSQISAWHSRR